MDTHSAFRSLQPIALLNMVPVEALAKLFQQDRPVVPEVLALHPPHTSANVKQPFRLAQIL